MCPHDEQAGLARLFRDARNFETLEASFETKTKQPFPPLVAQSFVALLAAA
jgi:hypothetical protein